MSNRLLHKRELIIVAALVLISLTALLVLRSSGSRGVAVVTYYNEVIERIDLRRDGIYHIQGNLPVTLEVLDGRIRFIDSVCPDHICQGYGWLGGETDNDIAICMPAGITVRVEKR